MPSKYLRAGVDPVRLRPGGHLSNDAALADTQNPAGRAGHRARADYAYLFNRVGQKHEPVLERELRAVSMA
jgi:hypothetical protein